MISPEASALLRGLRSDRDAAPYLPFEAPYRLAMGVKPLDTAEWIELDADLPDTLALKGRLLETRHEAVFAALPEAAEAAQELLLMLSTHLISYFPALFRRRGDRLEADLTGESWDLAQPQLHPLEIAGRLVQEDFCLLLPGEAGHRLIGAALCFPSRWHLAEKLDRNMGAIHGPVPGFGDKLLAPVDRFLGLLQPHNPVWRLNWFVHDDPSLFQPVRTPSPIPVTIANAGDLLYLRVERQTLRRLPASGAILFGIRTHVTPLGVAIANAASAAELAATIRSMPGPMRGYRQTPDFEDVLLAWLDRRAG